MKALKYLGAAILGMIITLVVLFVTSSSSSSDLEKTFESEIPGLVDQVTSWDVDTYRSIMIEQGFAQLSPDIWSKTLKAVSQIGDWFLKKNLNLKPIRTSMHL